MKTRRVCLGFGILIGCLGCGKDMPVSSAPDRTLDVHLLNDVKMEFVWIQPGAFRMGDPSSESLSRFAAVNARPQHEVNLSRGFYLGKFEVTQEQWTHLMGTTPWSDQGDRLDGTVQEDPHHPAVFISWEDAQAFVGRLNEMAGKPLYRLPTEAEWEYACRAGTSTRWFFGSQETFLDQFSWHRENTGEASSAYARKVGLKPANNWGLHDMYGNVSEWTQDGFRYYTPDKQTDPLGSSEAPYRVVRGGSFYDPFVIVHSASRQRVWIKKAAPYIGFRLLREQD